MQKNLKKIMLGIILVSFLFLGTGCDFGGVSLSSSNSIKKSDMVGFYSYPGSEFDDYLELKDDGTYFRQVNTGNGYVHYEGDYELTTHNDKDCIALEDQDDNGDYHTTYLVILNSGQLAFEDIYDQYNDLSFSSQQMVKVSESTVVYKKETPQKNEIHEEEIIEDNYSYLTELTYDELKDMKRKGKKFVFVITQTTCSHCIAYKPTLNEVAEEENIDIYIVDITKMNDEDYEAFKGDTQYIQEHERWGTPTTLIYEGDMELDSLVGDVDKDKVISFLKDNDLI